MNLQMSGSPSCPDAETLAAYIDDRVDAATRREVETHAADCEICASVLATTSLEARQVSGTAATSAKSEGPRFRRSRSLSVAGALAAAALLFAVVWTNDDRGASSVSATYLTRMAQGTEGVRVVEGRLPDFEYRRFGPQRRSAGGADQSGAVAAAAGTLEALPADSRAVDVLYTRGVAHLMLNDLDASARVLTAALELDSSDVRVLNALAVAALARGTYSGAEEDLESALEFAERAVRARPADPVGYFNSALALERLSRTEAAIERWRQVLRLDRTDWASEAEARLTKLTGGAGTR